MAATLTPKQARFVEEYLVDLNATAAAVRAGYSERTAESQASRLLRNVKVAAEIARRQHALSERVQVTQEMVVEGLLAEARRTDEGASHSARVSAWSLLGKHLGLFIDRAITDNTTRIIVEYEDDAGDDA